MSDQSEPLSERELEILRLVATGASNKEIAGTLVISPNTVKVHLRNIFTKVGVVSRTEATLYAIRSGLVSQPSPYSGIPQDDTAQTPDQDEISRTNPISVSTETAQILPETKSARRIPLGLSLAAFLLILFVAAGSAYAFWGRIQNPTGQQAPLTLTPGAIPPRWTLDTQLPMAVSGMGMSLYDGKYYLIAGSSGKSPLNNVYRFNPAVHTWEARAAKPTAASQIRAALIGELIYVPGGTTANGKPSDILEVYDPRHDTWESKQPLPTPISDYALAAFDGKLYLFGGYDGSAYSAGVYIYNPDTDTWKTGSPLPTGRSLASAESVDGRILVCGGFDGKNALNQVLIYYPTRDGAGDIPWVNGPELPQPRYGMNSASLTNMVFLFGGQAGPASTGANNDLGGLMLAADQAKWTAIDQPPRSFGSDGSAVASGNFIHIFGGGSQNQAGAQHLVYQAIYTIAIPLTSGQK